MLLLEDKADVATALNAIPCATAEWDFTSFGWDGLRDHHKTAIPDSLWRQNQH